MREININELKQIQLEMLKAIDLFCKKNEIRYSLAFGSLLGAVRHKGYIPWDDDLDIMLLRPDYDKLISLFSHPYYSLVDITKSKEYALPFAKIYDSRTIMDEFSNASKLYGVYIDVFPIDNAPDDILELSTFLKEKKRWNKIHILKIVKIRRDRNIFKNIILILGRLFLFPFSLHRIAKNMSDISSRYHGNDNCKLKGIIAPADNRMEELMDSSIFEEYETLPFEGINASIIKKYHEYLSASYGNYMQLPPEDKRVSHHAFKSYWK